MGNSNEHYFENYDWQPVGQIGNYAIEVDKRTGVHAERHMVPNNPKIPDDEELELYRYRSKTNKPIVRVYEAEYAKDANIGACGAAKNIVVRSEYIPRRLSNLENLTHAQALYVMNEALIGFQELHYRFGPFEITDDHIGFNQIGQCKVWHSRNFGVNHLERDSIVLMSTRNPRSFDSRMEIRQEQEMVEDIWLAVDRHANISPEFTQRANYLREKTFYEARTIIAEEIQHNASAVPAYLNLGQVPYVDPVSPNRLTDDTYRPNAQSVTSPYNDFNKPLTDSQIKYLKSSKTMVNGKLVQTGLQMNYSQPNHTSIMNPPATGNWAPATPALVGQNNQNLLPGGANITQGQNPNTAANFYGQGQNPVAPNIYGQGQNNANFMPVTTSLYGQGQNPNPMPVTNSIYGQGQSPRILPFNPNLMPGTANIYGQGTPVPLNPALYGQRPSGVAGNMPVTMATYAQPGY